MNSPSSQSLLDNFPFHEISSTRKYFRDFFIKEVEREIPWVVQIQKGRTTFKDKYFRFWSFFGNHTTYMIGLPIFFWMGFDHFARHLTILMALGMIICNFVKDYLCLPRPTSPPVVPFSDGYSKEFGFPSSHSVNALSLPLFSVYYLNFHSSLSLGMMENILICFVAFYICFSISYSRIYCGMHTPIDILGGFFFGLMIFGTWTYSLDIFEDWLVHSENLSIYITITILLFLWIYPKPVFETPSFEDGISFAFAATGTTFGGRFLSSLSSSSSSSSLFPFFTSSFVPFSFEEGGWISVFLRIVVGVSMILVWRIIAKKVCDLIFPPIFGYFNYSPSEQNDSKGSGKSKSNYLRKLNSDFAKRGVVYIGIGFIASALAPIVFVYFSF